MIPACTNIPMARDSNVPTSQLRIIFMFRALAYSGAKFKTAIYVMVIAVRTTTRK